MVGRPCPKHKAVIELVKKKTEENRIKEEQKKAALEAQQGSRPIDMDHKRRGKEQSEEDLPRLDKLEKQRMEKLARQRGESGKQPLPESYVKPEIRPFGGIRRVRE